MTTLQMFQVDAFADRPFAGNPAAVIKLERFLPDAVMQSIAAENNLSETAFVVPNDTGFDLRWFTPSVEIDFCGHATIATAHVLATEYNLAPPFTFHTKIGTLSVRKDGSNYVLNAPISPAQPTEVTPAMREAFPVPLQAAFHAGSNLYIVFERAADVRNIAPDMAKIIPLSRHGVGITAQGEDYDCVSRFFVPAEGIDEDPVTGSAHAAIGPYWAGQLGKTGLHAYQASARGGALMLSLLGDRIDIAGPAVTYLRGNIDLPT